MVITNRAGQLRGWNRKGCDRLQRDVEAPGEQRRVRADVLRGALPGAQEVRGKLLFTVDSPACNLDVQMFRILLLS